MRGVAMALPLANRFIDLDAGAARTDNQKASARPNSLVGERFLGDLRSYSANVAERDGNERVVRS